MRDERLCLVKRPEEEEGEGARGKRALLAVSGAAAFDERV